MEILWKGTVSTEFQKIRAKLCGNCVFPQYFHTRKLVEISVFYVVPDWVNLLNTRTWHLQKHIFNTPYKEVWPVFNYYHNGGVSCLVSVIVSYVLYFSSKIWPLSRFAPNILENYKSLKVLYIYKNYNVHSHIWKIFQNLWKVVCKVKAVQYLKVH